MYPNAPNTNTMYNFDGFEKLHFSSKLTE